MSTSELKFVMAKLDVHFTDQVKEVFSENYFFGMVICVGDAAFSSCNYIYCIQELQEMVLEADIDGDGQVTGSQRRLKSTCDHILGHIRRVPSHDDCRIVCFF